jgi:hypothetical protein
MFLCVFQARNLRPRAGLDMVGDMFNHGLQATVSGLCSELSSLLASQQMFLPPPPVVNGGFATAR